MKTIQDKIQIKRKIDIEGNISYDADLKTGGGIIAKAVDATQSAVVVFSFKMDSKNVCTITSCECGRIYTKNIEAVLSGEKRLSQEPSEKILRNVGEIIETHLADKYSIGITQFDYVEKNT